MLGELVHGGHVVEGGEVGVAGEGVAFFAIDENLHSQNARSVDRDGVDEIEAMRSTLRRRDAGAVRVGKSGVQVNDGFAGIDQEHASHFGSGADQVGRRLIQIERDQGA